MSREIGRLDTLRARNFTDNRFLLFEAEVKYT